MPYRPPGLAKSVNEMRAISAGERADFLDRLAALPRRNRQSPKVILDEMGKSKDWYYAHRRNWKEWASAIDALISYVQVPGENAVGPESTIYADDNFADFRAKFLNRDSPWFHLLLSDAIDRQKGGDIMLVVWPPEHGKSSMFADRMTMDLCIDPTIRMTVGHERKDQAEKIVAMVKGRMEAMAPGYVKLRERFGPFAPLNGFNAWRQPQAWSRDMFNVFKRQLGDEIDYNVQALGFNSGIAGTRCDRLLIDDPQSRKSLNLTDKIMETMRDDWFTRPGVTGSTCILMNVVGDGDIAEELVRSGAVDHVSILKAYDEEYLKLGPRRQKINPKTKRPIGDVQPSPWLWPERYSEDDYLRLKRNAGSEGWARKYQQDWRPSTDQSFTRAHVDQCRNRMRSIAHGVPPHPTNKAAEVACAIDPAFARTAVGAAAFEPTRLVVMDTYGQRQMGTVDQMIDLLLMEIDAHHRPPLAIVKWVIVETKGMQKGLAQDDRLLEYQADIGFEIVEQVTGFDKHDRDLGVASMARSMTRGEIDFPAATDADDERFENLYREMLDWRPDRRGNKLQQDELMVLWFMYTRWHKMRRRSIRRGADASQFGFAALPGRGTAPKSTSDWNFGIRRGA